MCDTIQRNQAVSPAVLLLDTSSDMRSLRIIQVCSGGIDVQKDWTMIGRDDRVENRDAGLTDGRRQMRANKDVIQSFGSSGIGGNIVM